MNILIIEDNPDILANAMDFFEAHGHSVDCAYNGMAGLQLAHTGRFDVIVLDLMLPRLDGIEVCRRLRNDYQCPTPILMLTARDTLDDKLAGFESGADDYLVKPFELAELLARVTALGRRAQTHVSSNEITLADLHINVSTYTVTRAGKSISLTPLVFKLLVLLARKSPHVVSRDEMLQELWQEDAPTSDSLRVHVHQLRQAIDKPFSTKIIHTVPGIGVRLEFRDDL